MKTAIRIYLAIYALVIGCYVWADGTVASEQLLTAAILSVVLYPPVFLPFAIWWLVFRGVRGFRRRKRNRMQTVLDTVLFGFSKNDPFTLRHLLEGGICILGRPGSAKTSSSGKIIATAIVRFALSGGLILGSAPTDLGMWRETFKKAGRSKDLIAFGPRHKHTFDFIPFLVGLGGDQNDVAKAILTVGESRGNEEADPGKQSEAFWKMQSFKQIACAIAVFMLAGEVVSIPNLHRFILTAAQTPDDLKMEEWKRGYHNQCFAKAFDTTKTSSQEHDYQIARDTWQTQWPTTDNRTRSNIEAVISGILFVFNSGQVRSLLSNGTTITPAIMDQGKWVFIDMSVGEYGSSGAFVLNAWKYAAQKYVIKRDDASWRHPIIIWADEAGKIVNSGDSFYLSESRKFGGASVYLAQSMQSFHAALGHERGKSQAEVLLGCFATKIFHAIGDPDTAEWASKLLGNEIMMRYSYSGGDGEHTAGEEAVGKSKMSFNSQEHVEPTLQSRDFMHGLRTGGKHNNYIADAIVIRTGEHWSNGRSWMRRSFSQR